MRIALLFICFILGTATAAEIHLRDGSVVIGTILTLDHSEDLVVDTEYMDEVVIEWEAVTEIRETQVIEVELFNGERLFGKVAVDEKGVSIITSMASTISTACSPATGSSVSPRSTSRSGKG